MVCEELPKKKSLESNSRFLVRLSQDIGATVLKILGAKLCYVSGCLIFWFDSQIFLSNFKK